MKPLCIDLYCGLGGWAEGFLSEGYRVVGFDIERHDYGTGGYPGQLVLQDATTLHGSQFKDAAVIVASPPCQEYSYMAMPWKRAKQIMKALHGEGEFPEGYTGSRTIAELNRLFDTCFRLQREASEAAGRYIPLIVENVRGAQRWVGRAKANFGSYYLWGDVGMVGKRVVAGVPRFGVSVSPMKSRKNGGGSWFAVANNTTSGHSRNPVTGEETKVRGHLNIRDGHTHTRHLTNPARHGSKSDSRKAASAAIAKIPYALASYIARSFYPRSEE